MSKYELSPKNVEDNYINNLKSRLYVTFILRNAKIAQSIQKLEQSLPKIKLVFETFKKEYHEANGHDQERSQIVSFHKFIRDTRAELDDPTLPVNIKMILRNIFHTIVNQLNLFSVGAVTLDKINIYNQAEIYLLLNALDPIKYIFNEDECKKELGDHIKFLLSSEDQIDNFISKFMSFSKNENEQEILKSLLKLASIINELKQNQVKYSDSEVTNKLYQDGNTWVIEVENKININSPRKVTSTKIGSGLIAGQLHEINECLKNSGISTEHQIIITNNDYKVKLIFNFQS